MKSLKMFTVDVHMVRGLTLALLHLLIGYVLLAYLKPADLPYVVFTLYTAGIWGMVAGWLFKSETIYESILPTVSIAAVLLLAWLWLPPTLEYTGLFMIVVVPISAAIAALKANQMLEELGVFKK